MILFTSDTHFGHANIIKYCDRPFDSVEEMDEELIANWNAQVNPGDRVYHLGDLSFWSYNKLAELVGKLNGELFVIKGNHDNHKALKRLAEEGKIGFVRDYYNLKVEDEEMGLTQNIVLCHYPFAVWDKAHHGSWHLHGHCHGTFPSDDKTARLDVGVDVHDYRPISYEEVKYIMTRKVFKPLKRRE